MAIRAVSHVAIGVRDMDRALRFYRDALGLRVKLDTVEEEPRKIENGGERRPQLVADHREEVRLRLRSALEVRRAIVELGVERDDTAVGLVELGVEARELGAQLIDLVQVFRHGAVRAALARAARAMMTVASSRPRR